MNDCCNFGMLFKKLFHKGIFAGKNAKNGNGITVWGHPSNDTSNVVIIYKAISTNGDVLSISDDAENVTFGYGDECVIEKSDFVINKGDFVGIKGPSGAGKSTIFKLLTISA